MTLRVGVVQDFAVEEERDFAVEEERKFEVGVQEVEECLKWEEVEECLKWEVEDLEMRLLNGTSESIGNLHTLLSFKVDIKIS